MEKKNLTDLEKMTAERQKAEKEYLDSQQALLNVHRIMREGIKGAEDLVKYLEFAIQDAKMMEDKGRVTNNSIIYSEAIAIRREFTKLLKLVFLASQNAYFETMNTGEGTEDAHRANNKGEEGYV